MLTKKIPVYYIPIALIAGIAIPLLLLGSVKKEKGEPASEPSVADGSDNNYNVKRMNGYQYIRPLLFAEQKTEAKRLMPLKGEIGNKIEQLKSAGILQSASVYIRFFGNRGEWMCYNEQETYNPGSLIKVPVLITILKMEEEHPGFLDKKIAYTRQEADVPDQTYNSKQIELGKSYTVKELLKYMIVYSDNNATSMLNQILDLNALKKTFTDLGLPEPNLMDKNFQISPMNYASFIKALYNASYISDEHSEFAMELMSQTNYKEGMVHGLPPNTAIAHKFGEGGTIQHQQLHESGIIYVGSKPYLLVIMTKGDDVHKLPGAIAELTRVVYEHMKALS